MAKNDSEIQKDVVEELAFEPSVDAARIGVAAGNGVVTLTGSVPSYADKLAAERATKRVGGVQGIADELTIDMPSTHQRDDTDIAAAAVKALQWTTSLPQDEITVKVSRGYLTLEGTTDWQYQKELAKRAVEHLVGVKGVTNNIHVTPHVSSGDVKSKIRQAFERSADIDANRVQVESVNGKITLRGVVRSWNEHDDATHAAYSVPGVSVVDNLTSVVNA